jgi:hypothetical protein
MLEHLPGCLSEHLPAHHAVITCYDSRLDNLVEEYVAKIRALGGHIEAKDIQRPPGGTHFLAGHRNERSTFYRMLDSLVDIAKIDVIHLIPHTNCQYCGIHHQEKLGNGCVSDLRFHIESAKKLFQGAQEHFQCRGNQAPTIVVPIGLTVDQRIVSIEESQALLPQVPDELPHGSPCLCASHSGNPILRFPHGT